MAKNWNTSAPIRDHILRLSDYDEHTPFGSNRDRKIIMFCPRCGDEFYHLWHVKYNQSGRAIETCPTCGMEYIFEKQYVARVMEKVYEDNTRIMYAERRGR